MRTRALGIIAVVAALCSGCQQPEATNEKQARLAAAENIELREQLTARQAETETLRQKYTQELLRRDEELVKCKARIAELQKDLDEGIAERVKAVTETVINENARLREENDSLKAEIDRLKAEVEQLQPPREAEPPENP